MDLLDKIKACQTMKQLDDLRQEIHIAATYNEIPDFPYLKAVFLEKKNELSLLREKKVRKAKCANLN